MDIHVRQARQWVVNSSHNNLRVEAVKRDVLFGLATLLVLALLRL